MDRIQLHPPSFLPRLTPHLFPKKPQATRRVRMSEQPMLRLSLSLEPAPPLGEARTSSSDTNCAPGLPTATSDVASPQNSNTCEGGSSGADAPSNTEIGARLESLERELLALKDGTAAANRRSSNHTHRLLEEQFEQIEERVEKLEERLVRKIEDCMTALCRRLDDGVARASKQK
ncbi:hypothetical protein BD779DRAFT_1113744 [Infundibulicybe gibba]|nr:hypothetical protein BD779DRAFT_1113744 [Infundibulicybe gibba]